MKRLCVWAVMFVLTASCSRKKEEAPVAKPEPKTESASHEGKAAPHTDETEEHEELPTKVRLSPKVIESAGLKMAVATSESLPETVDLTGELAVDPDRSARLAARVAGRVVDVRFKEGARVRAGETLVVLESPELARARATLSSASARARSARLNADRLKTLEGKALAAGQEVATADAEAAALEAEVVSAKQTLLAFGPDAEQAKGASARMVIRSPLAGFVLARDAVQGQTVDAEHVLAQIGDLERAYFLGRLFEKDLARVKVGARAEVRLNAYPDEVFEGSVETIGRQLDPTARTVTARILVRNHEDMLKVGLFGTARVITGPSSRQTRRVVVPLTAVTRIAEKDVVFVQQADGDFDIHPVTLGNTAASRVEILTGLREGERVVVDGVFTLKSAVLKSTFGEEE